MSKFLVHFTRRLQTFQIILTTGELKAKKPFGLGGSVSAVAATHTSLCLSEVPLNLVARLKKRHGEYGIGFTKEFMIGKGASRVWYLDENSNPLIQLQNNIDNLQKSGDFSNEVWQLTPFIEKVVPTIHDWTWEREWRIPGGMHFELSDIAFVITPSENGFDFIDQLEPPSSFYLHRFDETSWMSTPQLLGDAFEDMVSRFLTEFTDPVEYLPWDDGGYVWLVPSWETEDAVEFLFDNVEPNIHAKLCSFLNGTSTHWVRNKDWDKLKD